MSGPPARAARVVGDLQRKELNRRIGASEAQPINPRWQQLALNDAPVQPSSPTELILGHGDDQHHRVSEVDDAGPVVQRECAKCATESETDEEAQVQSSAPDEALTDQQDVTSEEAAKVPQEASAEDDAKVQAELRVDGEPAVQMWNCRKDEYEEPTCVQSKESEDVQAKCSSCEPEGVQQADHGESRSGATGTAKAANPRAIRQAASRGLANASATLPHLDTIQAAFGQHDVSHVRTGVGGEAGAAARSMGAEAFTSGSRIGFRESPSLRLAAHESAHVVQQREGLSLPDNVGRPGDRWEQHADRVADAVVAGESATPLLDDVTNEGGSDASTAVQGQITSLATRQWEPPLAGEAAERGQEEAGEQEAQEEASAEEQPEAEGEQTEQSALEAAEEIETEAPAAEEEAGGSPGGCEAATGREGTIHAPRYDEEAEEPPDGVDAPEVDNPSSEQEEESSIEFEEWRDELDECPAEEAVEQQAETLPLEVAPEGGVGGEIASQEGSANEPRGEATAGGETGAGTEEGQAVADAAVGGGVQATTDAASAGPEIATAEAARTQSIGEYYTSAAKLDGVVTQTSRLEQGFSFRPGKSEAADAVEQRAEADVQVRDFMRRATQQVADAVAFVQGEVPGLLRERAESVKADIAVRMEEEKAAISGRIEQARGLAMVEASGANDHVLGEHANAVSAINAETGAAIDALNGEHETSIDDVYEAERLGLEEVNRRFAQGRDDHEAEGPVYAGKAIERGQAHASAYEPHKGADYADDGVWDGCLTVRRARAQQDAACNAAKGYRDKFLLAANRKAYNLKDQRKEMRCAVIAGAQQVRATLDQTHDDLVSGLEAGRAATLGQLDRAREQSLASVADAFSATLDTLAAQEHAQRQAINDNGYLKQLAIEQLAHSVAAGLAQGVREAVAGLDAALRGLRSRFESGQAPSPEALAETLASVEEGLGDGMGTLLDKMQEGAFDALQRIGSTGDAAFEGMSGITASNDEQSTQVDSQLADTMATIKSGASTSIGELRDNLVEQAQQGAEAGVAAMQQIVAGYQEALEGIYTRIDEILGASLVELRDELGKTLGQLDNVIPCEAWKAAEKEQPAWKSVVAIILIIAIIIIVAVVAGPAVLALAGAVGPFLAGVIVGAIAGAISGGLMTIVNNWASGRAWDEGLADAIIMGAIGGALGGGLGFLGGALSAGVGTVARVAINLGADLVAEGLTQVVGYVAFGQGFNWEGFLMAGAMSGLGSLSGGGGRPRSGGADVPSGGRPRAGGPDVPSSGGRGSGGGVEAPGGGRGRGGGGVDVPGGAAGARAARSAVVRGVLQDLGVGVGFGLGIELVGMLFGREFDAQRMATSLAQVMSTRLGGRIGRGAAGTETTTTPRGEPRGRLGRAAQSLRDFDQRLSQGLEARGRRLEAGGQRLAEQGRGLVDRLRGGADRPGVDSGTSLGRLPDASTEVPPRRLDDPDPNAHRSVPDTEQGVAARAPASGDHTIKVLDDGRIVRCSPTCSTLQMLYGPELASNPRLREELAQIQQIRNPEVRAQRAAALEMRLAESVPPGRLVGSRGEVVAGPGVPNVGATIYGARPGEVLSGPRPPGEPPRILDSSGRPVDMDAIRQRRAQQAGGRRIDSQQFHSLVDDFANNVTSSNFTAWKQRLLDAGHSAATIRDVVHHGSLRKGTHIWGNDWMRYYTEISGTEIPRGQMDRPHAHHMAQKKGGGAPGAMNRQLLAEVGINPLLSRHNLEWAPNATGQHGRTPQAELLRRLLPVRGNRARIIEVLNEWRSVVVER